MSNCVIKYRDGRVETVPHADVAKKCATFTNLTTVDVNCTNGVHTYKEMTDAEMTKHKDEQAKAAVEQKAREDAEAAKAAQRVSDLATIKKGASAVGFGDALARLFGAN